MILQSETCDLETSTGTMRTYVYRPVAAGRYPGLLLFSEIFQQTGPIKRMAALLAGHGFVVAVPEIFHELEAPGTDWPTIRPARTKATRTRPPKPSPPTTTTPARSFAICSSHVACTGKIGSMGICIGGHLSFRAAMNPEVLAGACFYATDIHKRSLGARNERQLP